MIYVIEKHFKQNNQSILHAWRKKRTILFSKFNTHTNGFYEPNQAELQYLCKDKKH